ncbi:hypothetical protein ACIRL3_46110 [Streptomyces sp. NPDC102384]|uniref:hypothetical protein n=1 Tax=unclassified Streptomyces TaxID=2593676 RepID=UPI003820FBBC
MKRLKQRLLMLSAQPDPPKKLTGREVVATAVVFAIMIGAMGLGTGKGDNAIGGGIGGAGGSLLYRWWLGRTAQPEYEDETEGDH